jgi:Family of unknown function (DUF695).
MILVEKWFTVLSENEKGALITVIGRERIQNFMGTGKFKERVEITWKYEPETKGMPSTNTAALMNAVELAMRKKLERDKLAIMTGIYTGGGEKIWVFYTRTAKVFGERLNEALNFFEQTLPITIYVESDSEWEEYQDLYELIEYRVD